MSLSVFWGVWRTPIRTVIPLRSSQQHSRPHACRTRPPRPPVPPASLGCRYNLYSTTLSLVCETYIFSSPSRRLKLMSPHGRRTVSARRKKKKKKRFAFGNRNKRSTVCLEVGLVWQRYIRRYLCSLSGDVCTLALGLSLFYID